MRSFAYPQHPVLTMCEKQEMNNLETDLTEAFELLKDRDITASDVKNYINGILKMYYQTDTTPLSVGITPENKLHILKSNLHLKGNQELRHNAAIVEIESIISNATRIDKDGKVDLSHNKKGKALKHKRKVLEYIYFISPVRIAENHYSVELVTERLKGQNPNMLALYNVRVKKDPAATNLIALQTEVT